LKVVSVKDGVRLLSRISDSEYRYLRADTNTHTLQVIDYAHHEIHGGSMFRVQGNATAAALIIAFKVPDQAKEPHFTFEWSSESSGYIQLLEGYTWTAGTGVDRAPKNSNRNSSNTSVLQGNATGAWVSDYVTIDPTGGSGGTVISDKRFYTDDKQGSNSGSRKNEIVLATNQTYALIFTSTDGSKGIQIRCEWYEHTPKT